MKPSSLALRLAVPLVCLLLSSGVPADDEGEVLVLALTSATRGRLATCG